MKAARAGGARGASRVCDRFAFAGDRSHGERGGGSRELAEPQRGWGERCDPLARTR
jgi:hypothetical protein